MKGEKGDLIAFLLVYLNNKYIDLNYRRSDLLDRRVKEILLKESKDNRIGSIEEFENKEKEIYHFFYELHLHASKLDNPLGT